ncbi:CLIP-associating protein 2 isoform X2 [Tetranychus urticae]|nr:CLIP-associating protein 2 isoform X2 [Tetranychus urticae]
MPPLKPGLSSANKSAQSAGAVDEDIFLKAFDDTPKVNLQSLREAEAEFRSMCDLLNNSNIDWQRRIDALRHFRGLITAGLMEYKEIVDSLKLIELPFQVCAKDLRSQVVREACITIAFMSFKLGLKCARFCEALLPTLFNLIPNSAKIMSSSALVCIKLIIQHTKSARLIPVVAANLSSKSKEIRKASCEFLDIIVHTWSSHSLEKHTQQLAEAIRRGISDADAEARQSARRAFWGFAEHFKDQSESLLNSLDPSKQKALFSEHPSVSNSSSTNSLIQSDSGHHSLQPRLTYNSPRSMPFSSSSSVENLNRPCSSLSSMNRNRSGIPIFNSPKVDPVASSAPYPLRSTSAIDVGAARRARSRAAVAVANARSNYVSGDHLTRPPIKRTPTISSTISSKPNNNVTPTSDTITRSRGRISQSQPTSRSTSPSRTGISPIDSQASRSRRRSGIPVSTSRETSPSRSIASYAAMERRLSNSSGRSKLIASGSVESKTSGKQLMAEKILQQSQEAEAAMASALRTANPILPRHRYGFDDHSDESETSSVCSDRSFGGRNIEDVSEIIRNLSSNHWSDRKEGLLSLQFFLRHSTRSLHTYELKRITDIFTKMLLDPHTKTFTLFLEILNELIISYKHELNNWLYILMTRLFLKMGHDTLNSVQSKIAETLDLIRDSFSSCDQLHVIIRFLSDQTQTPGVKSKISTLLYLNCLLSTIEPGEWATNSQHETQVALMKIISWTADPKSSELRKCSAEALLNLFNLNETECLDNLYGLPKNYQDAALQVIKSKRRSAQEAHFAKISSPLHNPGASFFNGPSPSRHSYNDIDVISSGSRSHTINSQTKKFNKNEYLYDDAENMNPEEIYNSLKQTTDEIQKYQFEVTMDKTLTSSQTQVFSEGLKNGSNNDSNHMKAFLTSSQEIASLSKDSGISQIDGNIKPITNTPTRPNNSSCNSSPTRASKLFTENSATPTSFSGNQIEPDTPGIDNITLVLSNLKSSSKDIQFQKYALNELIELIRESNSQKWDKYFKDILKVLLDKISGDPNSIIRALSLKVMCELLVQQTHYFLDYIELTILRILEASKDTEKEVQSASSSAASTAAAVLPSEQCLKVLKSVITTGEFPMNQAAIKMLLKMIEKQSQETIEHLLPDMMPPLIQAYDNPESAVRKAAVFCMVGVHGRVGERMKPYLNGLSGSKMKLLKLYIDRAKSQSSGSNSPVNSKYDLVEMKK